LRRKSETKTFCIARSKKTGEKIATSNNKRNNDKPNKTVFCFSPGIEMRKIALPRQIKKMIQKIQESAGLFSIKAGSVSII